jgi:hypothetical protein
MKSVSFGKRSTRRLILIAGLLILIATMLVGWQIASAEIDSIEFHSDLRDIAAQTGANIGLDSPKTDDQVRGEIVTAAAGCGIHLQPEKIKLQRITIGHSATFDLAVDYTTRVNLLLYSFNLYFNQTSAK